MKCEECPGRFVAFTEKENRVLPPKGVLEPELYCDHCGTRMVSFGDYWHGEYNTSTGLPRWYRVKVACPLWKPTYDEETTKKRFLRKVIKKPIRSKHRRAYAIYLTYGKRNYKTSWDDDKDYNGHEYEEIFECSR